MSTGVIGVASAHGEAPERHPQAGRATDARGLARCGAGNHDDRHGAEAWRRAPRHLAMHEITLTGIAKGAGMIHPNMATMLSVIATDATDRTAAPAAGAGVCRCASASTASAWTATRAPTTQSSLLANGLAGNPEIVESTDVAYDQFCAALTDLCTELAQAIVRDGEGATKFVTIAVQRRDQRRRSSPGRKYDCNQSPGQDCVLWGRRQLGAHPGCGGSCRYPGRARADSPVH